MVSKIDQLRQWTNNEVFNARDYVYERDTVLNKVNELIAYAIKLDDELPNIVLADDQPTNQKNGDIWLDIKGG